MAFATPHLSLAHWVDPVFAGNLYNDHESTSTLWKLGTVDGVVAVIGVFIGLRLWITRAERPKLEWAFLRHSWYINELFDAVIGRPGTRLAEFSSTVIEDQVIDGAVNGTATLVRRTGTQLKRVQTGYVRNYALWIVVGVVVLFGFMLSRVWWS
jgi:NADH-quinone oxidoreductase subunit L